MEKFYPRMAQFARGEGYPCGNKGVFIPRRNKCWTHPKTGNRLTKPLTYQKYQEAKEKSQKSRTEKGRTALQNREQSFRDKARERVKGWQNNDIKPVSGKTLDIVGLAKESRANISSKNKEAVSKNLEQWKQVVSKLESGEGISKDINLNEWEEMTDNLDRIGGGGNVEFKKITGSISRILSKADSLNPLTQEDLEKAHPNFRPIMQRINKTVAKDSELFDKKQRVQKELNTLKQEKSYNEAVILNNSKRFREIGINNNEVEIQRLSKKKPSDSVEVRNPVSNLPERTISASRRIKELQDEIGELNNSEKAKIEEDRARKEIARLQSPMKDAESRINAILDEKKKLRESRGGSSSQSDPKQTPNSTGVKGAGGGKREADIKDTAPPTPKLKSKDHAANEKYDQWLISESQKLEGKEKNYSIGTESGKKSVRGKVYENFGIHEDRGRYNLTQLSSGKMLSYYDNEDQAKKSIVELNRSGGIDWKTKDLESIPGIQTKMKSVKRKIDAVIESDKRAKELIESMMIDHEKELWDRSDDLAGYGVKVPKKQKNNFNSNLKLANFAKPGCCCEASKPLKRRKTKQTPRLKRRGNKYA